MKRIEHIGCLAAMLLASASLAAARPSAAKPAGNPSDWIRPDDYPVTALRESEQGVAAFRLEVAADGHVTGCAITRSSGYPVLDETSCTLLKARASFVPASDRRGRAIASTYSDSIRWQIPDGPGSANLSMISCAFGLSSDIRVITPAGCMR